MPKAKPVRARYELRRMTEDGSLNQAFQLAHSIYRYKPSDREIALNVVSDALSAVKVRLLAQHEADRHDPQRPTKVRWNTLQWFQLLIYLKSEAYEKQQEANQRTSLSEQDMTVRYLKHLILTTCRRNSFHISLGVCRLIYDYSAAETMSIYDFVFQDPDSSTRKADAYYRARKNKLIEELKRRFHTFLRITEGSRGEKRFQSQDDSTKFAELVHDYLTYFTPWQTSCELPKPLDTWIAIRSLQSSQASQIHSLIHPLCFSRITKALKFDPPESRLALPRFFFSTEPTDDRAPPKDSLSISELTQEEIAEIRNRITDEERRRKKFMPRVLVVLADGIERARLNLAHTNEIRLDLEEDVRLIELVGSTEEGELLLASHLVMHDESDRQENRLNEYSLVLEGGQKVSLTVSLNPENAETVSVEIKYQQTKPFPALWFSHLQHQLSEWVGFKNWKTHPLLNPLAIVAGLGLIAGVVIVYFALKGRPANQIAQSQPTPSIIEPGRISTPEPSTFASPERTSTPAGKREPSPLNKSSESSVTREPTTRAIKSLSSVERIYVESLGTDEFSSTIRQKLLEKLQAGKRFVVVSAPNEADTAISGSARLEGKRREAGADREVEIGTLTIQLLNVSGDVLWRTPRFRGTPDQIASQFKMSLLGAINAEERRGKNKP